MSSSAFSRALDAYIPRVLGATGAPGVSLAVADRYGLVLTRGYGFADLATETPMTQHSLIRVGSMTKPITTMAALQLDESREFGIYDSLDDALSFPLRNPLGPCSLSPYHLLTHSSGLRTDTYYASLSPFDVPLKTFLRGLMSRGLAGEYAFEAPGALWVGPVAEGYRYSSLGIAVIGHLVEEVTGLPFGQYAREKIFARLGMTSSHIPDLGTSPSADVSSCATGYMRFGGWCVPTPQLHSAITPSTGLVTTMGDYARFLAALLNAGQAYSGSSVLGSAAVRHMLTPQRLGNFPGQDTHPVGLVMDMANVGRGDFFVGHSGAFPFGFWADSRVYPRLGVVVAAGQNQWEMTRYVNPTNRRASALVCDFVGRWFGGDHRIPDIPNSLAYQLAYANGLTVWDRVSGLLGAGSVTGDTIDEMVKGARAVPLATADAWDPQGFLDALASLQGVDPSPDSLRAFMESPDCAVPPPYLGLLALIAGGGRAELPVPIGFFADQVEADPTAGTHLRAIRSPDDDD